MVSNYKWVLKYIIKNMGAPALAPHGTVNNDCIQVMETTYSSLEVKNVFHSCATIGTFCVSMYYGASVKWYIVIRKL